MKRREWFRLAASAARKDDEVELFIYDAIGGMWDGVDAAAFVEALAALPEAVKTIKLRVNSPGGDPFAATAIANALAAHPARVETTIEGLAASAATIVTAGGSDVVRIADNALVMVHRPWALAVGDADELEKVAAALQALEEPIVTTYARKSKLKREEIAALMAAETWMDAEQAVENGFADEVFEPGEARTAAAATFDPRAVARLKAKAPEAFAARLAAFVRAPEPAPAPRPAPSTPPPVPTGPPAAGAAELLELCAGATLDVAFAQGLVAAGVSLESARERVNAEKERRAAAAARAVEIEALCNKAGLARFAAGYIAGDMPVAAVRAHLLDMTAMLDEAVSIDGSLPPDHSTRSKPTIDHAAVYAERNRRRDRREGA